MTPNKANRKRAAAPDNAALTYEQRLQRGDFDCPRCESTDTMWVFGGNGEEGLECNDCGNRWEAQS